MNIDVYSAAAQQEDESLRQLAAAWKPWILDSLRRDIGEDQLVRIMDGQAYSGLSFFVQAKSTADLTKLTTEDGLSVGYKIPVKKLLHWENSNPAVVLVVWDVQRGDGRWQDVPAIVKALDQKKPGWRSRREKKRKVEPSVVVHLPNAQNCLGEGQKALRGRLADLAAPAIMAANGPTEFSMSMTIPASEAGGAAQEAMRKFFDEGHSATFSSDELKVTWPEWHQRIYGESRSGPYTVTFGDARLPRVRVALELRSTLGDRQATIRTSLKNLRAGRKVRAWSNEHDAACPVRLEFESGTAGFRVLNSQLELPCRTLGQWWDLVAFLKLNAEGGDTVLYLDGEPMASFEFRPPKEFTYDSICEASRFLSELSFIQSRIGHIGRFDMSQGWLPVDQQRTRFLYQVLHDRVWEKADEVIQLAKPLTEMPPPAEPFTIVRGGVTVKLLGLRLLVGTLRATALDSSRAREIVREAIRSKSLEIRFEGFQWKVEALDEVSAAPPVRRSAPIRKRKRAK